MMKKILVITFIAMFTLIGVEYSLFAKQEGKKEITKADLKTQEDIASYGMGLGMGKNFLNKVDFDLNIELFMKGIKDGYIQDSKQLMTDEEIKNAMGEFQKILRAKRQEKMEKQGGENKVKGKKFLEKNKKEKGVITLSSGLQYRVIKEGKGPIPKETDTVSVHYKGTTLDGTEFDSSFKRNKPAKFNVKRVIKGWTEALLLMKVGSKWEVYIPSELGYGERGAGKNIGPNETLIFDVELLGIEEPKKPGKGKTTPQKEKKKK